MKESLQPVRVQELVYSDLVILVLLYLRPVVMVPPHEGFKVCYYVLCFVWSEFYVYSQVSMFSFLWQRHFERCEDLLEFIFVGKSISANQQSHQGFKLLGLSYSYLKLINKIQVLEKYWEKVQRTSGMWKIGPNYFRDDKDGIVSSSKTNNMD